MVPLLKTLLLAAAKGDGGDTPTPPIVLPSLWRGAVTFDPVIQSEYDSWAGAADFTWQTTNHDSWQNFDANVDYWLDQWSTDTRPRIWSIPLSVDGTSLASVAGGSNNSNFVTAFTKILEDAPPTGPIIIRLGWEMNLIGEWAWSSFGVEEEYIAAFRHVVGLARSVSDRFRFDWCVNWFGENPEPSYPGDDVVDIIGFDWYYTPFYENGPSNPPVNIDPIGVYNYQRDLAYGFVWHRNFAAAHNKPVSFPEFGVGWEKPQWLELALRWIVESNPVYHAYFDNNVDANFQCRISDGSKGLCGTAYLEHFADTVPPFGEDQLVGAGVGALPTSWLNSSQVDTTVEILGTEIVDSVSCLRVRINADTISGEHSRYFQVFYPNGWGGTAPVEIGDDLRNAVAIRVVNNTTGVDVLLGLDIFEHNASNDPLAQPGYYNGPIYNDFPMYASMYEFNHRLAQTGVARASAAIGVFMSAVGSVEFLIGAPRFTDA